MKTIGQGRGRDLLRCGLAALLLLTMPLTARAQSGAAGGATPGPERASAHPEHEALDPLAYTVVRTPPAEQVKDLPELVRDENVRIGKVRPFPERKVSDVFWYDRGGLNYGLVYQKRRAPLVFLIAGTGGSFNTDTNKLLAQILYRQGYHVLGFPSPTHPHFLINASASGIPGHMPDDARDLYRVMQLAYAQVKDRIEISDVYLTGYSLGGTHAAWVAKLDQEQGRIGFSKVLLLNPSVSLYNSVRRLDAMYDDNVPADPAARQAMYDRIIGAFAGVYAREQDTSLDGDFLYRAYHQLDPQPKGLETLIGFTFRYSLVNLAFTADVMSRGGYLVSPDAELGPTTSLTNVFKRAGQLNFIDFFDQLYVPYFQERDPALTRERAIFEAGLLPLESWLKASAEVGVISNRDDIILDRAEVAWLERTFGRRATLFEDGGHCGNYQRQDFVGALDRFFQG